MPHPSFPVRNFHVPLRTIWGFNDKELENGPVIGMEFENELPHPVDFGHTSGWKFHNENSLRDFGYEFVSTVPKRRDIVEKSVTSLFKCIDTALKNYKDVVGVEMKPSNSIRTSVHVHLDARMLTYIQVLNFATIYWLLEDFLTAFCGETRRGNLFCLRLRDATLQKYNVVGEIKNMTPYGSTAFTESQRYASLNLAAIRKFGSLESRLLRGTTDINVVMTWVDCLLAIYKFALQFKTPKDVQKHFLNSCDAGHYPAVVLGFGLSTKMKTLMEVPPSYTEIAQDIRENYVELVDLFNSHPTFDFTKEAAEHEIILAKIQKEKDEYYEKHLAKIKATKTPKTVILGGGYGSGGSTMPVDMVNLAALSPTPTPVYAGLPADLFSDEDEPPDHFEF